MYFLTQTIILSSFFIFLHQCILECFENKAVEKVMYKMCVYKDCSPEIMKYVHVCPDYFILIGLPLKSFASPSLFPVSPTSLSSLQSLFGLQWNFDAKPLPRCGELNMPCPDLLSAEPFIPLAGNIGLKNSEKKLFSVI